jgi:hypothetical protein
VKKRSTGSDDKIRSRRKSEAEFDARMENFLARALRALDAQISFCNLLERSSSRIARAFRRKEFNTR